jgi:hypothetical protein
VLLSILPHELSASCEQAFANDILVECSASSNNQSKEQSAIDCDDDVEEVSVDAVQREQGMTLDELEECCVDLDDFEVDSLIQPKRSSRSRANSTTSMVEASTSANKKRISRSTSTPVVSSKSKSKSTATSRRPKATVTVIKCANDIMQWLLEEFQLISDYHQLVDNPKPRARSTKSSGSSSTIASRLKAKMAKDDRGTDDSKPLQAKFARSTSSLASSPTFVLARPSTITLEALLESITCRRCTGTQLAVYFASVCWMHGFNARIVFALQPFPALPISVAGLGLSPEPLLQPAKPANIIDSPYFVYTVCPVSTSTAVSRHLSVLCFIKY